MNTVAINSLHRKINKTETLITSLRGAFDIPPLPQRDVACFLGQSQTTSAFSNAISSDAD